MRQKNIRRVKSAIEMAEICVKHIMEQSTVNAITADWGAVD